MLEIKLLSSAAHLSAKTREEAERALEEKINHEQ